MKWVRTLALVRRKYLAPGFVFVSCAISTSCASRGAALKNSGEKFFAVSSEKASFYRYGPQQGNGPDETLPRDTLMTLIRPSFGYCKVQLVGTSKQGYVASEDIKPAPATLIAALNAPARSAISARENLDFRMTEPPPPETLPDPDLPPAASEPSPQ